MKFKKLAAAVFTSAAILTAGVPVMAASFTTSDGALTLETPDDTWKEIHDPNTWVTLSNGTATITIFHYTAGEQLPALTAADDHFAQVYQTAISNRSETFVITGSVVDPANMPKIRAAVESTKVNETSARTPSSETKNKKPSSDYVIEETDETLYVSGADGLNIRQTYSANASLIGGYNYADAVHVTGIVMKDGQEVGWVRVESDGIIGYVASGFLTDTQPEVPQEKPADNTVYLTGNTVYLYYSNGYGVTVREYSDGTWRDDNGYYYTAEGAGNWSCSDGSSLTSNPPAANEEPSNNYVSEPNTSGLFTLTNASGETVAIYQQPDGTFVDAEGMAYQAEGAGQWSDSTGGIWTMQ